MSRLIKRKYLRKGDDIAIEIAGTRYYVHRDIVYWMLDVWQAIDSLHTRISKDHIIGDISNMKLKVVEDED